MIFKPMSSRDEPVGVRGVDVHDVEEYNKFISLIAGHKWGEAISFCNDMLSRWAKDGVEFSEIFRVYNNLGLCCLQTGKSAEAKRLFEMAIEIRPDYKQAKQNLDVINRVDPMEMMLEPILHKQFGDDWREKVKKNLEERKENEWTPERVKGLSTEDIVRKLHDIGIETNMEAFRPLVQKYLSVEEIAKEWEKVSMAKDWDEDFPWMAADELWKRWYPEKLNFEMAEDEFGLIMDELERDDKTSEGKRDRKARGRTCLKILEMVKKFFNKPLYDYWKEHSYWNVMWVLQESIYDLSNAGMFKEAFEAIDVFFGLTGDIYFLDQKAYVLCHSGRRSEGRELYKKLTGEHPDNFELYYHAGIESHDEYGDEPDLGQARFFFEKAHGLAKKDDNLAAERPLISSYLADICKRLGIEREAELLLERSKLEDEYLEGLEDLKSERERIEFEQGSKCRGAFEYYHAMRRNKPSTDMPKEPVKAGKIGRNDPCPCGSGKKYKKCCLVKESAEMSVKFERSRLEDGLRRKLMDFVDKKVPRSEFDKALTMVSDGLPLEFEHEEEDDKIMFLEANDHLIHGQVLSGSGLTVLETFAKEMSATLTDAELSLLKEWLTNRYGLWEVQDVLPGRWLTAKDVFSDITIRSVGEHTSKALTKYDIFMGRIETRSGNGAFTGTCFSVPRRSREDVVETICTAGKTAGYASPSDFVHANPIRAKKIVTELMKKEGDLKILDWDGYPAQDCHAVYELKGSKKLEKWFSSREDIERTGEFNFELLQCGPSAGKPCENPVPINGRGLRFGSELIDRSGNDKVRSIASLDIKDDRLEIFAISGARLDHCRSLLEKELSGCLKFRSEERKEFDLKNAHKDGKKEGPKSDDPPPELKTRLENKFMVEHYREWVDSSIPALNGATPRAALKDERLKPKLIGLLKDFINMDNRSGESHIHMIFEELGVSPEDLGLKI